MATKLARRPWVRHGRARVHAGVVGLVAVLCATAACAQKSAVGEASPPETVAPATTTTNTETETPERVQPVGFERVAATITGADGKVCEVCLWLAGTGDQRSRGLMGVTEVGTSDGTADGMAFVYPRPHTGTFWMKNTLLPLSIAFFAESGSYLSSFDMDPCTADPCPTYPTPADFTVAIEAPRGNLPSLAIAEGSTLALTDRPCS